MYININICIQKRYTVHIHVYLAVCYSALQCVAVPYMCAAVWCSVVQCGAVWCSVVQCAAVLDIYNIKSICIYTYILQCATVRCSVVQCVAVPYMCAAVWCSVVQCGAVCCSPRHLQYQ